MKATARSLLVVGPLLWASMAAAQEGPEITFSGFVSATAFVQDQSFAFGNGQSAEWAALGENTVDQWFLGGDVRNTRLSLAIAGPEVLNGWRTNGLIQMDFFGGFAGGAFGDEQPQPRLRLAYADLTKGGTTIRIGQAWTPLFGNVPASLSHIAFPLGYGSAGMIGWRYPGIFLYQRLSGESAATNVQLQVAAFRGSWVDNNEETPFGQGFGEAATIPQLEARLDFSGRIGRGIGWSAYAVGHIDQKDLSGVGREFPTTEEDELTGTAFEVGGSIAPGAFTVQGNTYWARAIGQQFGHITQFGDITGWGGWAQVGYAFNPRWSAWAFYGLADPDDEDVRTAIIGDARLQNQSASAMLRYTLGTYALGLEWLHSTTDWLTVGREEVERDANQLALSVLYSF
jgi:hypothetical protein